MSFPEILILGIGLSMDALAVAVCKGLSLKQFQIKHGLVIAAFFGFFQALMPLLGWLLGISFARYIEAVDHWIAFGLLLFIGGKMLWDTIREMKQDTTEESEDILKIGELFVLAIATSIDALAVGITFAFLNVSVSVSTASNLNIWYSILTIGCTTFLISLAGALLGSRVGSRFQEKAQIAGGIILILLGIKILLEHLGVISL